MDDPCFASSLDTTCVIYNYMARGVGEGLTSPVLIHAGAKNICPSATMLTSLGEYPGAAPASVAPLDNHGPFQAAIHDGNGVFIFSSENKVHSLRTTSLATGDYFSLSFKPPC